MMNLSYLLPLYMSFRVFGNYRLYSKKYHEGIAWKIWAVDI